MGKLGKNDSADLKNIYQIQVKQANQSDSKRLENNSKATRKQLERMALTKDIITEFCNLVEDDKEYDLKELKQILADIYNTKNGKKKTVMKAAAVIVAVDTDSDDDKPKKRGRPSKVKLDKDGNVKPKKAPTAYNNFVKQMMESLKKEHPDASAKELMGMVGGKWKALTKQEQETYK